MNDGSCVHCSEPFTVSLVRIRIVAMASLNTQSALTMPTIAVTLVVFRETGHTSSCRTLFSLSLSLRLQALAGPAYFEKSVPAPRPLLKACRCGRASKPLRQTELVTIVDYVHLHDAVLHSGKYMCITRKRQHNMARYFVFFK